MAWHFSPPPSKKKKNCWGGSENFDFGEEGSVMGEPIFPEGVGQRILGGNEKNT